MEKKDINNKSSTQVLKDALYKKAVGYDVEETTEEYAIDEENNSKLVKRKVSKKHYPPDLSAAKTILEMFSDEKDYSNMSDEELEQERKELIKYLVENSVIDYNQIDTKKDN